jgi:hypothetical protein
VHAVGVNADEVIPLLDAVGPKGMFNIASAAGEEEGRRVEEKVESFRRSPRPSSSVGTATPAPWASA